MNIKHIIFFDIKIETKEKNLKKEREVESKREKQYWKQKNPQHIQMITTDATVSKMEKMKKSDEKTTEKSQKKLQNKSKN